MKEVQRLFLVQAKSAYAVYILLNADRSLHHCHALHYLQMATELLSKANAWKFGPVKHSHNALVGFLRGLSHVWLFLSCFSGGAIYRNFNPEFRRLPYLRYGFVQSVALRLKQPGNAGTLAENPPSASVCGSTLRFIFHLRDSRIAVYD